MKGTIHKTAVLILLSTLLWSCATTDYFADDPVRQTDDLSDIQRDLVDSANWALGRKRLVVDGKKFNLDCSGVVMALYYRAGIDLQPLLSSYSGGGVQRLYSLMDEQALLYREPQLAPGDMLFWDDTYDRNKDGKINDPLTHMGMVVSVDKQGNVKYIHHNYRRGIVLEKMNLKDPDNLDLNSPMRARYAESGHAPRWLSSHLLRDAARGYELLDL
ncbi:MAG: NlpC/P60 family protein [Spirochaetales bacterium]|nr:NlpC/P60 family protein [Spirochaetales bacterium]